MIYFDSVKAGYSSDHINIDKLVHDKLTKMMPGDMEEISADIFLQDNIPLKDLTLNFVFDKKTISTLVYIFEKDDIEKIEHNNGESKAIGLMVLNEEITNLIYCDTKEARLFVIPQPELDSIENTDALNKMLAVWYRVQLLLLHPRAELIERKAKREKLHGKAKIDMQYNPRRVKYIKKYYITPEDIDLVINGEHKQTYQRKCLSWYVIGHWREYKNGKKVFIQGYWKGQLRSLKQNLDERERILDL